MSLEICPETKIIDNVHIIFDAKVVSDPSVEIFKYEKLIDLDLIVGSAHGRGETYFLRWDDQNWVLRHFRRGGVIAKFLKDIYFGINPKSTRSWREWQLLCDLHTAGFPVPRPVAARAVMKACSYKADLITVRIADANSLSDFLKKNVLSEKSWFFVGKCLRNFHDYGVYHADLNANNILLDKNGEIYLIDFDRCEIRTTKWWKSRNLKRLHRSLSKFKKKCSKFNFGEKEWNYFMQGYFAKNTEKFEL